MKKIKPTDKKLESLGSPLDGLNTRSSTPNIRIKLFGDDKVGKTSIINAYLKNDNNNSDNKLISDKYTKKMNINDNEYNIELFDGDGIDIDIDCYIIVFSLISKESYNIACDIITKEYDLDKFDSMDIIKCMILCGNKCDLIDKNNIMIRKDEILGFLGKYNNDIEYIETSAINNVNIDQLFVSVINGYQKKFDLIDKIQNETNNNQCYCSCILL